MKYMPLIWLSVLAAAMAIGETHAAPALCQAAPIGSGSKPFVKQNNYGACLLWWCEKGGKHYPEGGCEGFATRPNGYFELLSEYLHATPERRDEMFAAYGCTPGVQDCSRLNASVITMWNDLKTSTKPADTVFTVTPNGSYTTRPAYGRLTATTVTSSSVARVAVGQTCDCSVSVTRPGGMMCNVTGNDPSGNPLPALSADGTGGAMAYCGQ